MIPLAAKDISLFFDVVKYKIVTYSVRFIATDSVKRFLRITRLLKNKNTQVSGESGFYFVESLLTRSSVMSTKLHFVREKVFL